MCVDLQRLVNQSVSFRALVSKDKVESKGRILPTASGLHMHTHMLHTYRHEQNTVEKGNALVKEIRSIK